MLAHIDLSIGISGNMFLGALIDAGLEQVQVQSTLDALQIPGLSLQVQSVTRNSIAATYVEISAPDNQPPRHLSDIEGMLASADLPEAIREKSLAVFHRLAAAEARVHGTEVEQVHFHEVGATDAIADIVGVVAGLEAMGVKRLTSSPVPLSHGFVNSAHGLLPVPPPAVLALLEGFPVRGIDISGETVTPTGAALLTTLATSWGEVPTMQLQRLGHGAGTRDFPIPNIVRLLLGDLQSSQDSGVTDDPLLLLETNIDDMSAEWLGSIIEDCLALGAGDVWITPILMKKGRPAHLLSVLCPSALSAEIHAFLFAHTSTLGIRQTRIERTCLERVIEQVDTAYGPIRLKVATYAPGQRKASPEYEDCRKAAKRLNVSLSEIYAAALAAWERDKR